MSRKGEDKKLLSATFALPSLWQSLAVLLVVALGILLVATFVLHKEKVLPESSSTATSTPSTVTAIAPNSFNAIRLTGQAAIVVDLTTGNALFTQNADTRLPLASLTKLLTVYAASTVLSPKTLVSISSTSLAQDGDYGLVQEESFSFNDIARFALVGSSNDAAEAIAETAATQASVSIPELLASAAQAAGLRNTSSINGTGLDIDLTHASAYGSARDVAKLASAFLQKSPDLAHATTKSAVRIYATDGSAHYITNTDPNVITIPGILLSKTGYTDLAGGNLAVVFDAGIGHPVAIVVLGSTRAGRFSDVDMLIHASLAQFAGISAR